MARRPSWPRGWRPRLLTGALVLAVLATPSAAAAASPRGAGAPTTAQLTATIKDFLADRATRITGEVKVKRAQALGRGTRFAAKVDGMFGALDARRASIRRDKVQYRRAQVGVTIGKVTRSGATLTVTATERTKLSFRKFTGDEPDFTAYREDHVFTFERTARGWVLTDQKPVNTGALPPITEAIGVVATGDPKWEAPGTSSIERPAGNLPPDAKGVTLQGAISVMAIPPGLNYTAMVNYAVKYWTNYNPAYRSFAGSHGDCTNFISQVLREGGWAFKTGLWTDDNNWWYNALNQTHSWAGAENWSHFAPQRTTALTNIWQMSIADVLQLDFNKDGIMDHTMVVTKKTSSEIYMTYHTTDTLNRPLSELQALYANSAWWYSYRT